jgi:hypothetical protein
MRFNGYSPEEVQAVLKVQTFFAGYIVAFSDLSDLREIIGLVPRLSAALLYRPRHSSSLVSWHGPIWQLKWM